MRTVFSLLIFLSTFTNLLFSQDNNSNKIEELNPIQLIVNGKENKDITALVQLGKIIQRNGAVMYCKDGCHQYLTQINAKEDKPKTNKVAGSQAFFTVPKIIELKN